MLEAIGIGKRYPGVVALDAVNFEVRPGEVVGLLGENGAGKSTLIKVLGGLTKPDSGEIRVNGATVKVPNAAAATALGIGVIHQELNNLDNLDLAGNVFLGREPRKFGFWLDQAEMETRTEVFLRQLGLSLSPKTPLKELSIAQQQMVEIAKALSLEAKILIMDEPTSSLTSDETQRLIGVVKELRERGVGIVYVSHRLGEVKELADRVVGLRDGKNAGALAREEISTDAMVRLMVGRDIVREAGQPYQPRPGRLIVNQLRTRRFPKHEVSFEVGAGEIVALAGLVGAGRSEVVRAIFGVDRRVSGSVTLDSQSLPSGSPRHAIDAGLCLAPEDRRKEGLVTEMSVRENITMAGLRQYATAGLVNVAKETVTAEAMRESMSIKAPTVEARVKGLSGGNQQKVVLGKWLSMKPKCLIFDEPTRGIDVGARSQIYDIMRGLAGEGVAILMVSSDMEEVLALGDRVLVMQEGRLAGSLTREEASEESIMKLAVARG